MYNIDLKSPLLLVLEVTNECNLNCKYCYTKKRGEKSIFSIPFEILRDILLEAKELEIFDINIAGGEPFLYPSILEVIELIKKLGFGLSMVTNATLITPEIAQRLKELDVIQYIQVSFDGHNEKIHNITRCDFARAFNGFKMLVEFADSIEMAPSVGIVINKYNFRFLLDIINYFSFYTRRFHLMNVMLSPEFSLSFEEKKMLENEIIPKLHDLAVEKELIISGIRTNKSFNEFLLQNIHIDCLAGFTMLVISSSLQFYPCDIAPYYLGCYKGYGSIKQVYKYAKQLWKKRDKAWCEDFFIQPKLCCMYIK